MGHLKLRQPPDHPPFNRIPLLPGSTLQKVLRATRGIVPDKRHQSSYPSSPLANTEETLPGAAQVQGVHYHLKKPFSRCGLQERS